MKTKLLSLWLAAALIFGLSLPAAAEAGGAYKTLTLTAFGNLYPKREMEGVYADGLFYVSAEDLCLAVGGTVEEHTDKRLTVSCDRGMRTLTVDHASGRLTEDNDGCRRVLMPVLRYRDGYLYSLLHFLRYVGAAATIDEDGDPQIKIWLPKSVFSVLQDYSAKNLGNYFRWDELETTGNETIEKKLINAGVVALINRNNNIFRMIFDAKGIAREAVEEVLMNTLMNNGESAFPDGYPGLDSLNNLNGVLGMTAEFANFVVDAFPSESAKKLGNFIQEFSDVSALGMDIAVNAVNAMAAMEQFDAVTETQRTLLEKTVLDHWRDSEMLKGEWSIIREAARNVDRRAKDAYQNKFSAAQETTLRSAEGLLKNAASVGNPVMVAWDGVWLVNKLIPFTSNAISNKTNLYNAYNCSMIQLAANQLLTAAYSALYGARMYQDDAAKQENGFTYLKNALILQLKATIMTREYLIHSNYLDAGFASDMQRMNRETALLLADAETCRSPHVGMDPVVKDDLSWMDGAGEAVSSESDPAEDGSDPEEDTGEAERETKRGRSDSLKAEDHVSLFERIRGWFTSLRDNAAEGLSQKKEELKNKAREKAQDFVEEKSEEAMSWFLRLFENLLQWIYGLLTGG